MEVWRVGLLYRLGVYGCVFVCYGMEGSRIVIVIVSPVKPYLTPRFYAWYIVHES